MICPTQAAGLVGVRHALQQELFYEPHNFNSDFSLRGTYQGRTLEVFSRFPRRRKQARTVVRVRLSDSVSGLYFFISLGISLIPNIAQDKIRSGDPELDKCFEFGGQPQPQVDKLLHSPIFRALLKPIDLSSNFDRLSIADNLLEISGPFYLQEPAQLREYLAYTLQFVTVVEHELTAISDPSISTNLHE